MDAPGEEELEWMAMELQQQQQQQEDELLVHDEFFHQIDSVSHSGFHEANVSEPAAVCDGEPVILNDQELPVTRKTLVFPDLVLDQEPLPLKRKKSVLRDLTTKSQKVQEGPKQPERIVVDNSVPEEQADSKNPHRRAADIAGDCIPITGPSGERVYAELKRNFFSENVVHARREDQLLSESVQTLIEQLEQQHLDQILCEKVADNAPSVSSIRNFDKLWVDKYAPRSFTELLSDEQINREVLSWLKQWDQCVFGGRKQSTPTEVLVALRHHKHVSADTRTNRMTIANTNDGTKTDRPAQKALLLCGPPGLGKTTLAHVAARHCGYRVVEINASDDRTSSSLQAKILDAIQMKPVTGDSKPNCLIIDEIDGACTGTEGKGAINFLLELINAGSMPKGDESRTTTKKRTRVAQLSRPVICICNDLYVPALRSLRQVARVHVFCSPSPHRIVTRLKFICKVEGFKVTDRALTALAVHTESDIRSCLNTLQFLHQKGHALNPLDVGSQVIGRKDMTSSMFDIWSEIFQKKKQKPGAKQGGSHGQAEFIRLHDLFSNHGEYDLGMDGLFENFLHMHYHDAYLQKTMRCLDLFTESDIFGRRTIAQHQFFMNLYRPSFKLAIRGLIAQQIRPTIEWPKAMQRGKQLSAANLENIKFWLHSISPAVSRSLRCASLVQDVLSPLLLILSPNFRPVASNLLSQQERDDIKQVVDTMITYGLRYKKSRVDNSLTECKIAFEGFSLDPPLYSYINYKEYTRKHAQLSFAVQQMLWHEVELAAIKREAASKEASAPRQIQKNQTTSETTTSVCLKTTKCSLKGKETEAVSIATRSTAMKSTKTVVKQANFFDRFRMGCVKRDHSSSESMTAKRDSRPLLYKFHEGFTNAVKKPVHMRDLLS